MQFIGVLGDLCSIFGETGKVEMASLQGKDEQPGVSLWEDFNAQRCAWDE